MAAYAALVSLINNIQQITSHHRLSNSLDNKLTQTLVEKAGLLLDFMEAHNYGAGSKEAQDLERQIASAAHAAEDTIESHIVDQIHAGTCEVSPECSLYLQRMIKGMDAIIEKANEVKEKRGSEEERSTHRAGPPLMESGETAMVGLQNELTRLLDELTGHRSSRHTISIIGMGGMGKTTLAKNVYQHLLIKQHFDIRAWATISQQFYVKEILSQLLSIQGKPSDETADDLGVQLHNTLTGRRYLIVLDDVWSVEVWDKVSRFFPDNENGSRVVLTTRLSKVAIDCGSSCLTMNLLDENQSWKLFCKKAFQHEDCPPELEEVGKEIVESCKGLPLSIVVIGGSFVKSLRTVGYWKGVAKDIKSIPDSKEKQEGLDVLISSYNHLPPHLKPCFLYLGVYKSRYSEIRVSEMIKLWVAEGFLKSSGARVLEEIAEDYLKDLIDRNLISVGRRRDNGKIKSCNIHDLLRDLCLKLAEEQEFFHVREGGKPGTDRRVIYYNFWIPVTGSPLARSIMAFQVWGQVLDKYRLLRILKVVVHLGATEEFFGCVNLRYLNFDICGRGGPELPTAISLPWNMQTLIYNKSYKTVAAPIGIWKMQHLRHVDGGRTYLPDPCLSDRQDDFLILENLQTLKTAVNFRLSEEVCKVIPNIKKLKAFYSRDSQGYDDDLIEYLCNLDRLHKLETLNLSIPSFSDRFLDFKFTLPRSLNKLSLSYCQLDWEDLTIMGSLPLLEVLKLERQSVTKGEPCWNPIDGQFLRLKFLKINFSLLKYWNAEWSHFPVLEKLVLGRLSELEEIPSGIGEIPTLQLIRLECKSATISAVKIKEDRLENDDLQIQVALDDSDLPSFREMVKTKGLTIDNIQLERY